MTHSLTRRQSVFRRASFLLAGYGFLISGLTAGAVNLVQEFYLPMPASQILPAEQSINPITDTNMFIVTSILVTGDNTLIYYDFGRDGYETNLANPTQSTTQIWGDGNDAHGIPPGFVHNPTNLTAGTVITTSETIPVPSGTNLYLGSGGNHIGCNKALVISRAGWPTPTGPVAAGAVSVLSTLDFGTKFVSPVGVDLPDDTFNYVGLTVMAAQDGTAVTIITDPTNAVATTITTNLNQGQSILVNGGVKKGATVTTSLAAEVNLITGDNVNTYAIYWFTLFPKSEWSSSYFAPVPSVNVGGTLYATVNYFYNSSANPITILTTNSAGSGSFVIPANSGFPYQMPTNSGASFTSSAGEKYTVITVVATNPTNTPAGNLDPTYNWGYTPLPLSSLTTKAIVGWAPGSQDNSVNTSPVWVAPTAATTIYVVYPGTNNATLTDPNGGKYSVSYTLSGLQTQKIYNPNTNDQTGVIIYTIDGTTLSVAWGEDPTTAPTGNPGLDCGTTVLSFPVPNIQKSALIVTDVPPSGLSVGDTILYTVVADNRSLLPLGNTIVDTTGPNLSYVTNSTTLNGSPLADGTNGFPLSSPGYTIIFKSGQPTSVFTYLDKVIGPGNVSNTVSIAGTAISATNAIPPGSGAPPIYKQLYLSATNTPGVQVLNRINPAATANHGTNRTSVDLVSPAPTFKTISLQASATGTMNNQSTLSFAFTNNTGSNQMMLVGVSMDHGDNSKVNTITYGPKSLTNSLGVSSSGGSHSRAEIWFLPSPPTGSNTLTVTYSGNVHSVVGLATFTNVDLTLIPVGATNSSNGGNPDIASVTNSSTTNGLVFNAVTFGDHGGTLTLNSGSQLWNQLDGGNQVTCGGATIPGAASVTSSWTYSNNGKDWAIGAVSMSPATNPPTAGTNYTTFTQTPVFASSFIIASNRTIYVTNFITVTNGSMPANPAITATLQAGGTNIITLTTPYYSENPGVNTNLVWTGSVPLNYTVAAGQAISCTISNSQTGTAFHINYDTTNQPSQISLPALDLPGNVILITNLAVYSAPYPSSSSVSASAVGSTNFVRVTATDPFGSYDISSVNFSITGPVTNYNVTLTNPVATTAFSATFEYPWTTTASDAGSNSIATLAYEGSEGVYSYAVTNFTVNPSADVSIKKSANASVLAGQNLTYTIVVSNAGPSVAANVVAKDILPLGVAVFNAGGGTSNNGAVTWPVIATLPSGGSSNYTLIVTAPASGTLTNFASVTNTTPDPNLTNNTTPPVVTTVTPVADLVLGKVGPAGVMVTSNMVYVISVTNLGPSTASSVTVTDALPAGVTFVGASSGGVNTGGVVSWSLPSLTNGQWVSLTVTNLAPSNAPASGSITNVAFVSSPTQDPNPLNNTNVPVVTTVTNRADVFLLKTGAGGVLATNSLTYNLYVTNNGPSSAGGVTVTDALPAGVSFVGASGGGTTNGHAGVVSWSLGTLTGGQGTNLTVTVLAPSNAPASGSLTNVAFVSSPTPDPNPLNNTNTPVNTVVTNVADVGVSDVGPGNVLAGSLYTNTITVTNYGPSAASNVVVVVVQPDGSQVTNAVGPLLANQGTNYNVTFTAPGAGPLTNTASVSAGTLDLNLGNNTNGAVTAVTPVVGLVVGKSAAVSGVLATSNIVYTVTVTNNGPSSAGGVTVTDALPAGVSFVGATGGGTTNGHAGVVSWNVGTLNANQGTSFNVTGSAPAQAPVGGSVTNVAAGWAGTNGPVPSGPVIIGVTNVADVGVSDVGPGNVLAGSLYTNTITVTNYGPSAASNVVVVVVQPDGSQVTNAVGPLLANQGTNYNVTFTAPGAGPLTNTASVSAGTLDLNLGNNTNGAVTAVTPVVGLVVGKSAAVSGVLATSNIVYTVTVTNNGPSSAGGVTVTDALPAGVSFVGATGGGTTNGHAGVVSWNVGTLNANQGTSFNVTGSAPAQAPVGGSVTNVAAGWAGTNGPVPSGPVIIGVTNVADVGVSDVGPGNVLAGSLYTNTITVTNYGPSAASNVVVVVVQPDGSQVTNAVGPLLANQGTNYNVTFTAPGAGPLTNTASVSAGTLDLNLGNNTNGAVTAVTPVVGLVVGKSAAVSGVLATSNIVYTVTVTNNGPSSAGGVTVTDALPAGVSFVGATGGGTTNGHAGVVSWNVGTLNANQGTSFNVTGSAPAQAPVGGSVTNVAAGWAGTNGPVPSGPVIIGVTNVADVGVSDVGPGNVLAGSLYTNTITVTNYGPSAASNVVVVVVQPDGSQVTNAVGPLLANQGTNYNVTFTAPGAGPLTNTASVSAGTLDLNLGNNTNGAVTAVTPVVGLVVGKSAAVSGVLATSNIVYTVTVTNNGPSSAGGVTVTDALPAGVSFVGATGGGTTNGHAGVVSWNVGTLNANQGTSFNVTGSAPAQAPVGGSVTNVAAGWAGTNGPVPSGPVIIGVTNVADVGVSDVGPGNVLAGSLYTNTITVTNYGPSAASNVVVVVVQPDGSQVTNAVGPLLANQGTNYNVTFTAPGAGPLTNTASVSAGTLDLNLGNNTNGAVTAVTPVVGLVVGKSAAVSGVLATSNIVYTVTVTNNGPSSAGGVTVTDALPAGVSFVGATGGGTTNGHAGVVSWNVGTLNANQGTSFNVTGSAPAQAPVGGSVTNVAAGWAGTNGPVPSGPVIIGVTNVADVGVSDVGPGNVLAGSLYTNTITVTNYGPSAASNVVVVVVQPDGSQVTNAVGPLLANQGTNYNVTFTAPGAGPLTNTASVSAGTLDLNLGNNTNGAVTAVTPVVGLVVGKSAAVSGVLATSNIVYTVTVTNNGPSSAGGVTVTDALPAGVSFVGATGGGTTNGHAGVVSWNVGTLNANQGTSFNVTGSAPAQAPVGGSVTNVAAGWAGTNGPVPSGPVIIGVTNVADVGVSDVGPGNVLAGSLYTNTITVTNYGPSAASNVVVVVVQPDGSQVTNAVGPLLANQGTNYNVTFTAPGAGPLTNTASVSAGTLDLNLGNNTNGAVTAVTPVVGLVVGKSAAVSGVLATSNIVYTVTVTNNGPSSAGGVTVTDALPAGVSFVGATGGGTTNGHAGVVSWNVGTLNANQGTSFNVTGSAPAQAPVGGSVTNVAAGWAGTNGPVPSGPVIIGVTNVADVGVSDVGPGNVLAGSLYTNTITVTNYGPSAASNVVVVVVQPDGSQVTNAVGPLLANQGTNYNVTFTAPGAGPLTNTASVSAGTLDLNLGNNTNGAVTAVTPVVGLVVGKSAAVSGVLATSNIVYTVTVTNNGPSSAGGVTVTDALPAGVSFVGATGGGTTNGHAGVVSWNVGTLNANQGTSFNVTGSAPAQAPVGGSVTNVAAGWAGTNGPVPSGPVIIGVTNVADVGVSDVGPGNVLAGSLYTNTITVTNYGPSAASNVVVVVVQPDGSQVTNAVGPLLANQGTNYNVTFTAPGAGPLTNTASVSAGTLDLNLGNNTNGAVTAVTPVVGLVVGKSAAVSGVLATSNIVYTVTVTNNGPSSAGGVTVTDALPAGVSFVGATGGGTTNGHAGVVSWNVGTLNANQGTSFNVTGSAPAQAPVGGSVTNVAAGWAGTNGPVPSGPVIIGVTNVADVGVSDVGPGNVLAGSLYTNTITVTNYGPSAASNVVVVVVQPDGSQVTNAVGPLLANQGTNYNVTFTAPGAGPLTNTASVSAGTLDLNLGNNTNGAVTAVTPVVGLVVGKSAAVSGVLATSNIVYTVTVTNNGPSSAGGVTVTDALPAGVSFVGATGGGTTNGHAGVVSWNVGTLNANQGTSFNVTGSAPAQAPVGGSVTNVAAGWAGTNGPVPSGPVIIGVTNVADVGVSDVGPGNVLAGSLYTNTITVTNYGPSAASNVVVVVVQPDGSQVTNAVGPLLANQGTNYNVTFTAPGAGPLTNTASVSAGTLDLNLGNNTNGAVTAVTNAGPAADVAVFLTGPTNAYQGSNIVYQLTVTNLGPSVSSNIVVSNTLPAGLAYVGASGGGVLSNNVVTWPQITSLAVGGSTNYFITNNGASSGLFTNIAAAFSLKTYDPNLTNNNGTSPASQVQTLVALPQFTNFASTNMLNRQNGLYEELLIVTNTGTLTVAGIRVLVYGLPGGATPVTLWNATGTNSSGVPYVEYDATLVPGATVSFALEFYDPYRIGFNPTNYVVQFLTMLPTPAVAPTNGFISGLNIYTDSRTNNVYYPFGVGMRFFLGFPTVIGKTYTIIYSDTLVPAHWTVAVPAFTATANTTFWYDDGPPKTVSRPQNNFSRFYRVVQQ